jgi:hypothetical protein
MDLTGLGQSGLGTDVGVESGNCGSSPHTMPKATCPTSHHAYLYLDNIYMYIYIERQDGSDVREPGRARGMRASADRERRQSK